MREVIKHKTGYTNCSFLCMYIEKPEVNLLPFGVAEGVKRTNEDRNQRIQFTFKKCHDEHI